ncbi:Splicing factor 3B subunit 4 [Entophlyctis luteolus]|nr:Splicing factor 3B subunit 4 [Entophlyctis luteolus]KAJ3381360.1 Splicing factor 3B subunit 4 [Entophlyctis sp. JEL0112]
MQNPYKPTEERNQQNTVYVGNLDEAVTEALLWELMLQAGPVVNVHLPKDRVTQTHQGFGFAEYTSEEEADYAMKIMHMTKLFGKPIKVNKASDNKHVIDVGANLFLGNLDHSVDEKTLHDTFSAFGVIAQTPKIARDPDTGMSKGYGFVSYDNFESSDAAIEAMNGQYLMNKPITVSYAFKKDGQGERHGSAAERLLAAQARKNAPSQMPNRLFADIPTPAGVPPMPGMPAPAMPAMGQIPMPMGQMPMGMMPPQQPFGYPQGMVPPAMPGYPVPSAFGQAMPYGQPAAMQGPPPVSFMQPMPQEYIYATPQQRQQWGL